MKYTVIAGVNGVGKSSIYSILSKNEKEELGIRINADDIVLSMGSWQDKDVQYKAGIQTIRNIKSCFEKCKVFHQETTLSGYSIINNIMKAKKLGYKVDVWYVYVENLEILKQRIIERVKLGGHGIEENLVEKRFISSFNNFENIFKTVDEVRIYDNTYYFELKAKIVKNKIIFIDSNLQEKYKNMLLE